MDCQSQIVESDRSIFYICNSGDPHSFFTVSIPCIRHDLNKAYPLPQDILSARKGSSQLSSKILKKTGKKESLHLIKSISFKPSQLPPNFPLGQQTKEKKKNAMFLQLFS
jgi:hypothetical protein